MTSKYILDTNVIVRYILADDQQQFAQAKKIFLSKKKLVIPIHVFCELDWVLRQYAKLSRLEVVDLFMELANNSQIICQYHLVLMAVEFLKQGGDFADGVNYYSGQQMGGQVFVTFDKKASKVISHLNSDDGILLLK